MTALAYSAGVFLETQITNYLKLRVAGGYQNIDFDNIGLVNDPQDVSDYYANLSLSHRVNSVLTHSLSAGHETQLGVNSNFTTLNYVRHTANWNILYHTLLSTELFYEDAEDSGGSPILVPDSRGFSLQSFRGGTHSSLRRCAHARLSADAARHARISLSIYPEGFRSAAARLHARIAFRLMAPTVSKETIAIA